MRKYWKIEFKFNNGFIKRKFCHNFYTFEDDIINWANEYKKEINKTELNKKIISFEAVKIVEIELF